MPKNYLHISANSNEDNKYQLAVFAPLPTQSLFKIYSLEIDGNDLKFELQKELSSPIVSKEELLDFGLMLKSNTLEGFLLLLLLFFF